MNKFEVLLTLSCVSFPNEYISLSFYQLMSFHFVCSYRYTDYLSSDSSDLKFKYH